MPGLAFVASGALIVGAVAASPATAAQHRLGAAPKVAAHHAAPSGQSAHRPLTASQKAQLKQRQSQLAAKTAPTLNKAAAKTFTVNTTADTHLGNSANTHCVDTAGKCSLRAAVEAANNLSVPVRIVLGSHTYTLTLATVLRVTNPKGVSVVGHGASKTAVAGDGSQIFYVTATGSGVPSGHLFLTSLKLKNGTGTDGGAIFLDDFTGSDVVLNHVTASNNSASSAGGAIYADYYNGIFISDSTFTNNHAPSGGAIFADGSAVKVHGSTFNGNTTGSGNAGDGGAFYIETSLLDMTGGSISHNQAGDASNVGEGGAIYDDDESQILLTGVHVDNNTATSGGSNSGYGGAIFADYDAVSVTNGSMSHNVAQGSDGSGGAIYTEYGTQLGLHHVVMAGNRAQGTGATDGGGAVYVYGYYYYPSQLTIDSGSRITGSNASAVYLDGDEGGVDATIENSTLSGNSDTVYNGMSGSRGCGGAVCAYQAEYSGVNLSMTGNHLTGNRSTASYGSGAVEVYSYDYGQGSLQLTRNVFTKNHAGANGYGGAVGLYGGDAYSPVTLRSTSNRFIANSAGTQGGYGAGGAVFLYYYATMQDHGSTFSNNRALGDGAYGGAVNDWGYQSSTFTRSTFTGNTAGMNVPTNNGYGGAYYSEDESGGNLFTQVTMSGNKAAWGGGGFYGDSDDYEATFKSSTLSGNTAGTSDHAGFGGGIYDSSDAVVSIENSTLTGNTALSHGSSPGTGGAIWHAGTRVDLAYSTVSGNYAKRGAGIFSSGKGGSLLSSIVSANRASKHGAERDCAVATPESELASLGGNVLGQGSCVTGLQGGDKVTTHPGVGPLKSNGGPTKTMALSSKSPALGRGTFLIPSTDQRGHKRPKNHADAGAYER